MNIHEFQAKELFHKNGVAAPKGYLATSPIEAEFAFDRLGEKIAVVKAQIHAGGRGKGGGVKLVKSSEECAKVAKEMLGMTLVTHQTGLEGKKVNKVYIEAGSDIDKEYYLALLVDRETTGINLIFSKEGGMDIEEVADKTPEKVISLSIDPITGLMPYHFRTLADKADLSKVELKEIKTFVTKLYAMFYKYDFSMIEINPLIVTKDSKVMALDGKMNFDDNALFRHKEIEALRDFEEEDSREIEASKYGLSYIGLDGDIGCLVNGAGLAMATMDIIKHYGSEPANFLDVGGGATEEQVKNAFRILLEDDNVKAIFVNIFGGIMQCDVIAKGIVAAASDLSLNIPLVVRLSGTNFKEGKAILESSDLKIISADDMADGAKKVVEAIQ